MAVPVRCAQSITSVLAMAEVRGRNSLSCWSLVSAKWTHFGFSFGRQMFVSDGCRLKWTLESVWKNNVHTSWDWNKILRNALRNFLFFLLHVDLIKINYFLFLWPFMRSFLRGSFLKAFICITSLSVIKASCWSRKILILNLTDEAQNKWLTIEPSNRTIRRGQCWGQILLPYLRSSSPFFFSC